MPKNSGKILTFLLILIFTYFFISNKKPTESIRYGLSESPTSDISWQFNKIDGWQASQEPPSCEDPLIFPPPVDLSLLSGILYPGQLRGNDYKPHGGFRFDDRSTNDVILSAIMDGYILKASKYEVDGEVQTLIFYVNECGIMVMHDHLLTLSPKLEEALSDIPIGQNGDSRTTEIRPRIYIEKGEVLATEIGFKKNKNIFVDFGLYDLRNINNIEYSAKFRENHSNIGEYGTYALCWYENFSTENKTKVKNLPAGGHEGKISDYCK